MIKSMRILLQIQSLYKFKDVPLRRMSSFIKPKFKSGNAEPHELMKQFKQLLYRDGEPVLSLIGALSVSAVVIFLLVFHPEKLKREAEWCELNNQTMLNYPIPTRDDS